LEDYTKFKLKKKEELAPFLEDKNNLFVVACNKCFKEFELCDEPESAMFEQIAAEQGKTLVGSTKVDFLCNKTTTAKKLQAVLPAEAENVFVISCGLGIQTVADLLDDAPQLGSRLYLLEDCTSPVVVPGVVDYTDDADRAFAEFGERGAHVVRSTEPMAGWPGLAPTT
jgi:nicotinamidase-related amidase